MTWRHGLFVHWPVDPDALESCVPSQLTLERRDGRAWVSVLPFVLVNVGLRGSPSITRLAVPELNVRTYVRYRGDPGLFFFSIDLGRPLFAAAIARTTRLPVTAARIRVSAIEDSVAFSSRRSLRPFAPSVDAVCRPGIDSGARFEATYEPVGETFTPDPGTLAHWLVERRRFYAPGDSDVLAGEIAHDPWPLQPAAVTIHENTMFEVNGLPSPVDDPLVHYCGELPMTGSIPRRL